MKILYAVGLAGCALVAAHARDHDSAPEAVPAAAVETAGRSDWTRPLGDPATHVTTLLHPHVPSSDEAPENKDIDVVDAHWMALTMWGEARSHGEEGMRAVGHIIHNRWQKKERAGAYVTDTVSEAWQFSCWNPTDPNRAKMLAIDALPPGTEEHRQWLVARRLADEILSGRSTDPTGGALFYHTTAVSPRWSRGIPPVTRIGDHVFFAVAN